jgi:hypothetical protein
VGNGTITDKSPWGVWPAVTVLGITNATAIAAGGRTPVRDLYINQCGDTVARHDLVQVDEAGAPLLTLAPAAYEPKEIIGPLDSPA